MYVVIGLLGLILSAFSAQAGSYPTPTITFQQSGTGARASTIDEKLKAQWVSITDFCSPAQIASDITTCAQAAIDSIAPPNNSYGGGTVYFPSRNGPYTITGPIYLNKSFTRIKGENVQGTYINCATGANDCVVIGSLATATRSQSIEDIGIFGNGLKTAGANVKIQGNTFGILLKRTQIEYCITCINIGPGNNGTTIRDATIAPNQASSLYGIYWHAPGDGSARNDVLTLDNVVISGMLSTSKYGPATGLLWEGFANTLVGSSVRILHMTYGLRVVAAPGAVGSAYDPSFLNWHDFEAEGFNTRAVSIEAGSEFRITGSDMNNMATIANQTGADDYAVYFAGTNTRGLMIDNSRIGNSRQAGLFNNGNNLQLSNVQFFSTSMAGVGSYPVIDVGSSAKNSQFTNITCEELGGAAKASYCLNIASGATLTQAAGFDTSRINNSKWFNDPGNSMSWNAMGGFGTYRSSADGGTAGLRVDQNSDTIFKIVNGTSGSLASSRLDQSVGTANAYTAIALQDNSGNPYWRFSAGPGVKGALITIPLASSAYNRSVPTSGGTVTIGDLQDDAILEPAAGLATLTVNLPTCGAFADGKVSTISTTQTITALTVGATAGTVVGAPSTLSANTAARFRCVSSVTKWYRQ